MRKTIAAGLAALGLLVAAPAAFGWGHPSVSVDCVGGHYRNTDWRGAVDDVLWVDGARVNSHQASGLADDVTFAEVGYKFLAGPHRIGFRSSVHGSPGEALYAEQTLDCTPAVAPPPHARKPPHRRHRPRVCRPARVRVHGHVIRASRVVTVLTDTGGEMHGTRVRVPKGAKVATVLRGCGKSRTVTWGTPPGGNG